MENETNSKEKGFGGVIGAIVIIVILIAGGWYFIGGRVEELQKQKNANATTTVSNVPLTGSSTDINDLQTDLNNVNLKALDLP